MVEQDNGTFALAYYHKPSREWWYIPTVPEGRKWRGPFDNLVLAVKDMAEGTHVNITTVCPKHLLTEGVYEP